MGLFWALLILAAVITAAALLFVIVAHTVGDGDSFHEWLDDEDGAP